MVNRLFVDIHVLQSVPPSCVNRDDTGSPKTAFYGGVTRARVSSQAWKKAIRDYFPQVFEKEKLGKRTKRIVSMVITYFPDTMTYDEKEKAAEKVLTAAGLKIKNASDGTNALFFMSHAQAKALADLFVNNNGKIDKKDAQEALRQQPGIDIALFGRMVADDPSLNTDACSQVAHAISTHAVQNEYDYFTAVDDLQDEDNAGAGHLGTVEFNSSTLYRYATVAVHALGDVIGKEETPEVIKGFIDAFAMTMPTGKVNTFANETLPDAILVTLREDRPVSLVGAFEKPIYTNSNGYLNPSEKALVKYAKTLYANYSAPEKSYVLGEGFAELGSPQPLEDLKNQVAEEISKFLEA